MYFEGIFTFAGRQRGAFPILLLAIRRGGEKMQATFDQFKASRDRLSGVSLEKYRIRLYIFLMICDAALMASAMLIVGNFYIGELIFTGPGLGRASAFTFIFVILSFYLGLYSIKTISSTRRMAIAVVHTSIVAAVVFLTVTFFTKTTAETSRIIFTFGLFFGTIFVLLFNISVLMLIRARTGTTFSNVIIVDAGGAPIALQNCSYFDARHLCLDTLKRSPFQFHELGAQLRNMDRVIVNCPSEDRADWALVVKALGVRAEITSPILEVMGALAIEKEEGFTTILVATGPLSLRKRIMKRVLDLSIAIPAVLALSPLFFVIVLAILIDDFGPVFFRQRRTGRNNCFFTMLKFRSMRVEQSDSDGNISASRDDDRVTRVGQFLRRTSLDELPQLFNVILGQMSIVGPRPHAVGSRAGEKLFWEVTTEYWQRHAIKPGLTGLAQVRGFRGATECEEDLTRRLDADLEYLDRWSPLRDIKLIVRTLGVLVHPKAF